MILSGLFDPSPEEAVEFVLDEQESAIEFVPVLALDGKSAVGVEVVGPEFEDGAPEGGDPGVVTGSGDEDSVVEV